MKCLELEQLSHDLVGKVICRVFALMYLTTESMPGAFYLWASSFMKKNNLCFTWITVKWAFCYVQPNLTHGWYSEISKSQYAAMSQAMDCLELEGNMIQSREGPAEWRALVFILCASVWASPHSLSSLYDLRLYWCSRLSCQRDSLGFLCLRGIAFNEQLLCSFPH